MTTPADRRARRDPTTGCRWPPARPCATPSTRPWRWPGGPRRRCAATRSSSSTSPSSRCCSPRCSPTSSAARSPGSVADYLPVIIPGILAQTALTACMATGIQLREDMDKGVFDRFKSLPIARIAPLAGPALADLLRYATAATLTILVGLLMGYRPGGGVPGVLGRHRADGHRRLVAGLDLHLARHRRPQRPGGAGHLDDDHVPADVPVQRVRPGGHPARPGCRRSSRSTRCRTSSRRSAT